MFRPLTWILLVVACIMIALLLWDGKPAAGGFFVPPSKPSIETEKTFYKEEIINPSQHLPMVHVASLVDCGDGILTACWYGGSAECAPDVQIYSAMRGAPQAAWSQSYSVMTREQAQRDLMRPVKSLGNVVLLYGPHNTLRLLFVTIAMGKWSGSQLNLCTLFKPDGLHSPAKRLTISPFFNFSELVRNRPVETVDGGWCVPVYQEFLGKFPELLWFREVRGKIAYQKTRIAGGCTSFQPSLIPLDTNHAIALMRDFTDMRRIFLSRTDDGGLSWTKPMPTDLPNPDAGISGLRLSDGNLLVAYNDSTIDRSNLSLALSHDGGLSWKRIAVLEKEPNASFSYPFLLKTADGLIQMAYTYKGQQIKMASFNESWIREQELVAGKGSTP